jgi:hypothetical protein
MLVLNRGVVKVTIASAFASFSIARSGKSAYLGVSRFSLQLVCGNSKFCYPQLVMQQLVNVRTSGVLSHYRVEIRVQPFEVVIIS